MSWSFPDHFLIISWSCPDHVLIMSWSCHDHVLFFNDNVLNMSWSFIQSPSWSLFKVGIGYWSSFLSFGNNDTLGSIPGFIIQETGTGPFDYRAWLTNRWHHLCMSYTFATNHIQAVKVSSKPFPLFEGLYGFQIPESPRAEQMCLLWCFEWVFLDMNSPLYTPFVMWLKNEFWVMVIFTHKHKVCYIASCPT